MFAQGVAATQSTSSRSECHAACDCTPTALSECSLLASQACEGAAQLICAFGRNNFDGLTFNSHTRMSAVDCVVLF